MKLPLLRRSALALVVLMLAGVRPAAAQGDSSFNLVNRSGQAIQELYVSSTQVNTWGQDLLGRNILENGRSFAVRLPAGQCNNDIRVVFGGGRSEERRGVDTCQMTDVVFGNQVRPGGASKRGPAAAARTGNPSFNLVNQTSKTILVLRASPSSDTSWGDDRLGDTTVPPGATFAIRLPAGDCSYDIRVEYDDRSAEERRAVDLCNVANVTFP
ncbi:hypothetical protein [Roseomonas xinghualingensis]|uniref:hypothetical protein n=1 Tax=Roseomonas xinghualingensis TaxID=2986475 RepID=UPI0021F14B72|nr:hypothetical protein [Roseomonas sp. SXEYE001]MCV4206970.1 hypothetical protein [Roseomonas sp. SXEYE001]